ncbi:MAG TPA: serine/threonine-protein kinase [Vicinamibacteria bacterium]|nr:serine/threonine-protein kinase [Vicinamibacteria bacterium]
MSDPPPPTIGRYGIRREIGRGMMGVVYEAFDPSLDRIVALKTVGLAFPVSDEERKIFEERFFREARIAAKLSHPGIVAVHDAGRDAETGTLFITLEYLKGETLEHKARLPWRAALRITARLAEVLQHAHSQGIVHRDMKPANVMVLESGDVKLMDFGIATITEARGELTFAGQSLGTPLFMAPEQAAGLPVDARTDLFSLGSIAYTLLTGSRAFEAESVPEVLARVVHDQPTPPSVLVPEIPKDVDRVIARAMAKNRDERYPSGTFFAEDLEDLIAERAPRHLEGPATERGASTISAQSLELVPLTPESPEAAPQETLDLRPFGPFPGRTRKSGRLTLAVGLAGLLLGLLSFPGNPGMSLPSPAPRPAPGGEQASPEPTPFPESPEALFPQARPAMGFLDVTVEHPLKSGTLILFVDGQKALTAALSSRVTKKILFVTIRKGALERDLEVAPGQHQIRVEVRWDENTETDEIRGTFTPGKTEHLEVKVGRLLKGLSLDWR